MDLSRVRRYWVLAGPAAAIAAWAAIPIGHLVMSYPSGVRYQLAAGVAAALAAWSLFRFCADVRRDRLVADTPLVKIRSAAQGYVKVFGSARPFLDGPMVAPLSSRPCVWWSYSVERRVADGGREDGWHLVDCASSIEPFVLADAEAECLVGPCNAEITPSSSDVWYGYTPRPIGPPKPDGIILQDHNFRYTEQLLSVGDHLSVTGELRSQSELNSDGTAGLLHQWKQDQRGLLARFDRNHDGRIDASEWEIARQAAIAQARVDALKTPVIRTTVIGEPTHGEPFLIAPMDASRLVRREQWHAFLYLVIGAVCIVVCALALERATALPA